jgi:predicted anti-sigma-YlaC factor YlaD
VTGVGPSSQLSGNPECVMSDWTDVTCEPWQLAISARLDGEESLVEPRLLEAHLARCGDCREYLAVAESTRRSVRLQPAPVMPDMSRRLVKANAIADRAASVSIVRALLAVVAIEVIAFSLKALVLGDANAASTHAARHLGAFSCAYGIGLLVVVVRPARARTMLPVAAVLAGALAITAIIDVAQGRIPFVSEATHLPELISVVLIWLLAVPSSDRRVSGAAGSLPSLRSIRPDESRDHPTRVSGE